MKKQGVLAFPKLLAVLFVFFFSYSIQAQTSFGINDPNIVYKDKDGNLMTKDSVESFISKGSFSMMKKDLGDGKIEIRLIRETKKDIDARANVSKEWISKWIDKPFPNFTLSTLTGKSINQTDLIGKVTVINFWFTGCQPCIGEMPQLNMLVKKYESVNFLAFTFNETNAVKTFLTKHEFNYTQLPNAQELIKSLEIDSFPTHMIIDKNGIVRGIEIGATSNIYDTLVTLIDKVAQ
jgi:thiol-disulfide isomerase/thioredoxin